MFLFVINYGSAMFLPQFMANFTELASLWTYTPHAVTYTEELYFIHQCLNITAQF
jgi:hypothetical protein